MGSLALVLILSAIAGIVGYATFDSRILQTSVEAKAGVYATQPGVAALQRRSRRTTRRWLDAVIKPLESDRNVFGSRGVRA